MSKKFKIKSVRSSVVADEMKSNKGYGYGIEGMGMMQHDHALELIRPGTLVVPQKEPTNMREGEVALYISDSGVGGETPAGGSGVSSYVDLQDKPKLNGIELVGNKSLTDLGIASAISDYVTSIKGVATGLAGLGADGKVLSSQLPDFLLGQLLYGGNINASSVATLSSTFKSRYKITTDTLTITSALASTYNNVYFICSANSTSGIVKTLNCAVGDWVISNGIEWNKIDNTDAVSSVAGLVGTITANALVTALIDEIKKVKVNNAVNADKLNNIEAKKYLYASAQVYNRDNNLVVKTNRIPTPGTFFQIHIKGNGYNRGIPLDTYIHCYYYKPTSGETFYNNHAINNGLALKGLQVFKDADGYFCLYIPRQGMYQTFEVFITTNSINYNIVDIITENSVPTTATLVTDITIYDSYNSKNSNKLNADWSAKYINLPILTTAPTISEGVALYFSEEGTGAETLTGGGVSNYVDLQDKPKLNGIELKSGNNTLADLGIAPLNHTHTIAQITSLQTTLDSKVKRIIVGETSYNPTSGVVTLPAYLTSYVDLQDKPKLNGIELKSGNNTLADLGIAPLNHTHTIAQITSLQTTLDSKVKQVKIGTTVYNPVSGIVTLPAYPTSLPASDVADWAKQPNKPAYTTKEVTENTNLYFTNVRAISALKSTTDALQTAIEAKWAYDEDTIKAVKVNNAVNADKLNSKDANYYLTNNLSFQNQSRIDGKYDATECLLNGGMITNDENTSKWLNAPSGMSFGSVLMLKSTYAYSISAQLAWDINHNTDNPTRNLWFRAKNNKGFANDWVKIWHSGNSNLLSVDWRAKKLKSQTLVIPTTEPTDLVSDEIGLYCNESGTGGETPALPEEWLSNYYPKSEIDRKISELQMRDYNLYNALVALQQRVNALENK